MWHFLKIDSYALMQDNSRMNTETLKSELHEMADRLPDTASYDDVMYELYVHMKIAKGRQAAEDGRVVPHDEVKRRFSK